MREVYQNEEDGNVVDDTLEGMVREGARRMLAAALEEEVSAWAGIAMSEGRSSADTGTVIIQAGS